jgi:hypothetical protein
MIPIKEENKVVPYELKDKSPAALAMHGLAQGWTFEQLTQLEKFMELQERHEANEAKKAFTVAMANFKKDAPNIIKKSKVDFSSQKGRTHYNYANLADIMNQVSELLSANGLTVSWRVTKQDEKNICVAGRITHILGHFEETTLCAAPDLSGNKNSIQAVGSTISYLERYTMLSIVGLATHEMDNDGKPETKIEYITEKQVSEIIDMLDNTNSDKAKFLEYYGVEDIQSIPKKQYQQVVSTLKAKLKESK